MLCTTPRIQLHHITDSPLHIISLTRRACGLASPHVGSVEPQALSHQLFSGRRGSFLIARNCDGSRDNGLSSCTAMPQEPFPLPVTRHTRPARTIGFPIQGSCDGRLNCTRRTWPTDGWLPVVSVINARPPRDKSTSVPSVRASVFLANHTGHRYSRRLCLRLSLDTSSSLTRRTPGLGCVDDCLSHPGE